MLLNVLLAMLMEDLVDLRQKIQNRTYGPVVRRYTNDLIGDSAIAPDWRWTDAQARMWWLLHLQIGGDDLQFFSWLDDQYPSVTIIGIWEYATGIPYGMVLDSQGQVSGVPVRAYRRAIHMRFVSKIRVYDGAGNVISATTRFGLVDDYFWVG